MYAECQAYREAVQDDKARIKAWQRLMTQVPQELQSPSSVSALLPNQHNALDLLDHEVVSTPVLDNRDSITTATYHDNHHPSTEEAFQTEIAFLEAACQQHRDELLHFRALQHEQQQLGLELDRLHEALSHEQNALVLEARAFDNDQEHLASILLDLQDEVERLSSCTVKLPATLLRLQVDRERGLRYPLINELRLAYRPKGDVQWKEIQAAWALAAQLLLSIGTLFQFQQKSSSNSSNNNCWKVIPLAHCAKLFYYPPERTNTSDDTASATRNTASTRPVVFNLGHPKTNHSKALLTWNALLCQMVHHVSSKLAVAIDVGIVDAEDVPPLPFEIALTKIGNTSLSHLDEDDDGGWSRVIHYMSSDLLWLSDCASTFVRQQVVLESSTTTFNTQGANAL